MSLTILLNSFGYFFKLIDGLSRAAGFEQPLGRPLQILKMIEEKIWRSQFDNLRTAVEAFAA
jgi:hypothetical protein